jgi:hypothetical protein
VTPKHQKTENENLDAIELGKRCLFRQLEFVFSGKLLKKKGKLLPTRLYDDDDDDYGENKKSNCSDGFHSPSTSLSPAVSRRLSPFKKEFSLMVNSYENLRFLQSPVELYDSNFFPKKTSFSPFSLAVGTNFYSFLKNCLVGTISTNYWMGLMLKNGKRQVQTN